MFPSLFEKQKICEFSKSFLFDQVKPGEDAPSCRNIFSVNFCRRAFFSVLPPRKFFNFSVGFKQWVSFTSSQSNDGLRLCELSRELEESALGFVFTMYVCEVRAPVTTTSVHLAPSNKQAHCVSISKNCEQYATPF